MPHLCLSFNSLQPFLFPLRTQRKSGLLFKHGFHHEEETQLRVGLSSGVLLLNHSLINGREKYTSAVAHH